MYKRQAAALVEVVLRPPVAAHLGRAVRAHGHAVGGGQLEDALEEGLVERAELEAQVLQMCIRDRKRM